MRLKVQQKELQDLNKKYLNQVGVSSRASSNPFVFEQNKEREVKEKGDFLGQAGRELDHRHARFEQIKMNYDQLDEREKANTKNLRGLINYSKKLTLELDQQRDKVQMAESIIEDLK